MNECATYLPLDKGRVSIGYTPGLWMTVSLLALSGIGRSSTGIWLKSGVDHTLIVLSIAIVIQQV